MAEDAYINRFRGATYNFYRWRYESDILVKVGLAGLFACLTGFGALVKVYLPWTPVPITGQLFFVLASGVVLGKHFAGLSQILYPLVGVLGVPWFAGSNASPTPLVDGLPGLYQGVGGFAILTGATFGYIIGFIVAASLVGWAVDSRVKFRRAPSLAVLLLLGVWIVYAIGAVWFYAWWSLTPGAIARFGDPSLGGLLLLAIVPFVPLDLVKAGVVFLIGGTILPKRPFADEKDAPAA